MKKITIIGAGLVGSLLSIYLQKRGYKVSIYEKRADIRKGPAQGGRSINLALSHRGIKALEKAGALDLLEGNMIPMKGRMVHNIEKSPEFFPYGKEGQAINSISRSKLNELLLEKAALSGVEMHFQHTCTGVDFDKTIAYFEKGDEAQPISKSSDIIIGADGAFSALRYQMMKNEKLNYAQSYLEHGYKELTIASEKGKFALEKNALHIWPRKSYMLIALPNMDGTFTCTLFFPFKGKTSFEALSKKEEVLHFFKEQFPDALEHMPQLTEDFFNNPTSSLVTIKTAPWNRHNCLLIGDAAHAIVPFYGQGMNAGFEDCYVLNDLLNTYNDDWDAVIGEFQNIRKPNTDAIADLAVNNFYEMRDLVSDPRFILRKKIETKLMKLFPEEWLTLYSMVTFSDIPYAQAYREGKLQEEYMEGLLKKYDYNEQIFDIINYNEIIEGYKEYKKASIEKKGINI